MNFINNTGGKVSSALTVFLTYPGGGSIPAVMSDVSFAGNVGTDDRVPTYFGGSDTVWHCRRGSWMPTSGALYGDFSAPECYACPAGYVGSAAFLTNASCSGQCPTGHFCKEGTATPQPCPSGTFMPARGAASGASCIPCAPGQHQPDSGKVECLPCPAGSFSPELGQAVCEACPKGGYCEDAGAASRLVWQPCPAGSFNPRNGSSSRAACDLCPTGTASAAPGADSMGTCSPCRPGTFAAAAGLSECASCEPGTASGSGSEHCSECSAGSYAASPAQAECNICPHPLDSEAHSVTCSFCKVGYYLQQDSSADDAVFASPTDYCKPCPPNADCSAPNTTVETLGVPRGYWRASSLTTEIHECIASDHCSGSSGKVERSSRRQLNAAAPGDGAHGQGCDAGYTGPLCEWCVSQGQHFDRGERGCVGCPSTRVRFGIFSGAVVAAAGAALLLRIAMTRCEVCRRGDRLTHRFGAVASRVGLQPKIKILVSFYQVAATLGPVYGVRLHEDFTRWTDLVDDAFNFDLLGLTYPPACLGSMRERLLLGAVWPFAAILVGAAALACNVAVRMLSNRADTDLRRAIGHETLRRLLYWAIFVAYFVLPSVSRSIFKARQCVSFNVNDLTGARRSYLVADLDVLCSADDDEYSGLDAYFWAFFVLWPVLVPLAFLALLLSIRSEVRAQQVGPLAKACRFLWRDYDPGFLFWEVVDLSRKLFLASLVLFVDPEFGSSKLERLVVAAVVSALYLAALALARPFKRSDDLHLACIANLLLTCCFVLGTAVQICEGTYEDLCYTLVGFHNARGTSQFVVALTAAMLVLSALVILFKTFSAVRAPTIRLASTGLPPNLELPSEVHFHGFISHAWATGQDQTHTIVRQLQRLLPGVRIWLDVDNLDDVGRLEESVADAMTFLVFLSCGYFESWNCRRELYAALALTRPFIPIHEADTAKATPYP